MKRKIVLIVVEVVLAAAIIGAIWCLTVQIATPIKWEKDRKSREETVIKKLKDIRLAQRTYKSKYQRFTADFDTLTNFILTEQMEGERKLIDEDDSVAMAQARKKYGKKFKNVEKYMKDEKTGLYYHGYDESREMYWADPKTGCSPNFWLRSLGWFSLALTETAMACDEALYYEKRYLIGLLEKLVDALIPFQDESGMFYQVPDKPDDERNYLETSGTALIAYAILKAVRLGFISPRYAAVGEKAFDGICESYLSKNEDGTLKLGGICLVAGLGGAQHRDGSLEYYFSEPVVENEAKGVAPFLLAYTEILRKDSE